MSHFIKFSFAAVFATVAMTGLSHAAMSVADKALAADHHPRIMISSPDEIEKHSPFQDFLGSLTPNSPDVRGVQAAIRENPVLRKELLSQNVELKHVIYADEASDGSFVIYVQ